MGTGRGFGVPGSGVKCSLARARNPDDASCERTTLRLKQIGLVTDLEVDAHFWIPAAGLRKLTILGRQGQVRVVAVRRPGGKLRIELTSGQVVLPAAWGDLSGIELLVPPGSLKRE